MLQRIREILFKYNYLLLWIVVFVSIYINFSGVMATLPILKDVRYGDYLGQRWFLTIIAFFIFAIYLYRQTNIFRKLKENLFAILLIALALIVARWFTFDNWFYYDDFRILSHHFAEDPGVGCCGTGYYGFGIIYFVIRFFGPIFELYNGLALFIFFLAGGAIYFLANQLQKNKYISLISAIFFVTTPTYFQETLSMNEFLGDGFSLLLFVLAIHLLIARFWPGAVIFTAAALEFGFSRTHFIALPLFLIGLFVIPKTKSERVSWALTLLSFPTLTYFYMRLLGSTGSNISQILEERAIVIFDVILGVVLSPIFYPIVALFRWVSRDFIYLSILLGVLFIIFFLSLSTWLFIKSKFLPAKNILFGLSIIITSVLLPTLIGSRIFYQIKDMNRQYHPTLIEPVSATGYGLFAALGLSLIIVGLGQIIQRRLFIKFMVILILLNMMVFIKSDRDRIISYAFKLRSMNTQLQKILPSDKQPKIVFIPGGRHLWDGIFYYRAIYGAKEKIEMAQDPKEFAQLLDKYQPALDHIYLLAIDTETYHIFDLSDKLRPDPKKLKEAVAQARIDMSPYQKVIILPIPE